MSTTTASAGPRTAAHPVHPVRSLVRRWPVLAGVAMAAFVAYDLSFGSDLAPVLAASALVYLGAAVLGRGATWPVFFGAFALMMVTEVLAGLAGVNDVETTWFVLAAAVPLAAYGLWRGAVRPAHGLPLQALAMAGFGAAAVVTVLVGGDAAAYLVAAGLLGHAAWDVWHHRTGRVVTRSLAEFCVVLDTLIAVAMVVVAVRG